MTVVTTLGEKGVMGDKRYATGTTVLSGSVRTAEVVTGLTSVDGFFHIEIGTTAKAVSVNESFPLASGTITAYTEDDDATFSWIAIGN